MRISDWSSDVCSSDLFHFTDILPGTGIARQRRYGNIKQKVRRNFMIEISDQKEPVVPQPDFQTCIKLPVFFPTQVAIAYAAWPDSIDQGSAIDTEYIILNGKTPYMVVVADQVVTGIAETGAQL